MRRPPALRHQSQTFGREGLDLERPTPANRVEVLPASRTRLQDALTAAGAGAARLVRTCDCGDNWRHRIAAAPTDGPLPGQPYPRLVDAQGRCPPEDVGDAPGHQHFLDAIANPSHPDHETLPEWHGGPFNPAVPPTDELQLDVLKPAKRWKAKQWPGPLTGCS